MELEMPAFLIVATWDDEAGVWVAESDDIPGLATEAATKEQLEEKLRTMIPELCEANRVASPLPDIVLRWHQETRFKVAV